MQVVSYPYEEQIADHVSGKPVTAEMVKVRMVPTQPMTIDEVWVDNLEPFMPGDGPLPRGVEFARVTCSHRRQFVEDMLRYDCCALVDHEQDERDFRMIGEPVMIYRCNAYAQWHPNRWLSFGLLLEEMNTVLFSDIVGEELVK